LSRAFLLLLILLWRLLGRPYDTSASLDPPCLSSHHLLQDLSAEPGRGSEAADSALWSRLGRIIEGSIVWDSVYFVRIAQCSYEYEQTFAFLPIFPLAIRLIARTGAWYIVK
jgi:phosphatidylinositol glycan class V